MNLLKHLILFLLFFGFVIINVQSQTVEKDTVRASDFIQKASEFHSIGEFDSTFHYMNLAKSIYLTYGINENALQTLFFIGILFREINEFDSALIVFNEVLAYNDLVDQDSREIFISTNIRRGEIYYQIGKYDSSLAVMQRANELSINLDSLHPLRMSIYINLGNAYAAKEFHNQALYFYQLAHSLSVDSNGPDLYYQIQAKMNIGAAYSEMNNIDLALGYLKAANDLIYNSYNDYNETSAIIFSNIATILCDNGNYSEGFENFFKAIDIYHKYKGELHPRLVTIYANVGAAYNSIDDYDNALVYLLKAEKTFTTLELKNYDELARIYHEIGVVYANKNQPNFALKYHLNALAIYQDHESGSLRELPTLYGSIGMDYSKLGNCNESIKYLKLAVESSNKVFGINSINGASIYNQYGSELFDCGEQEAGLRFMHKALEIVRHSYGNNHPDLIMIYEDLGRSYGLLKDYDTSLVYFEKAIDQCRHYYGLKNPRTAWSYNKIGLIYFLTGNPEIGLQYSQMALVASLADFNDSTVFTNPPIKGVLDYDVLLNTLGYKAYYYSVLGYREIDAGLLVKGLEILSICDTVLDRIRMTIQSQDDSYAFSSQASEIYQLAISNCQFLYLMTDDKAYLETIYYYMEKNRSRILTEAIIKSNVQKFGQVPDSLLEYEKNILYKIHEYEFALESLSGNHHRSKIDSLIAYQKKHYELINKFKTEYPNYFQLIKNSEINGLEDIQATLDKKTALLSYSLDDEEIFILLIQANKVNLYNIQLDSTFFNDLIEFKRCISYYSGSLENENQIVNAGHSLFNTIIPEEISHRIKNIIIIPDGILNTLPFEALIINKGKDGTLLESEYFIRKYNVSYYVSSDLYYRYKMEQNETFQDPYKWIGLAPVFENRPYIDLDERNVDILSSVDQDLNLFSNNRSNLYTFGNIQTLPATKQEVENIYNKFRLKDFIATVLTNEEVTETYIKSPKLHEYNIIHLATHGFVNQINPELSGLIFESDSMGENDGILYTKEIYDLNWNSILLILSACETGLGRYIKGEGVTGLARAFLYAGTKNLVVTLWKVADESTSIFMDVFYDSFLNQESDLMKYAPPLRTAKIRMIESERYYHPFFWAPFILIGE